MLRSIASIEKQTATISIRNASKPQRIMATGQVVGMAKDNAPRKNMAANERKACKDLRDA